MEYPNIERFLGCKLDEIDIKDVDRFFWKYGKTEAFRCFMSLKLNEHSIRIKRFIETNNDKILKFDLLFFDIFLEQDNQRREERVRKILNPEESNLIESNDLCLFLLDWMISLHHNPSPWIKSKN